MPRCCSKSIRCAKSSPPLAISSPSPGTRNATAAGVIEHAVTEFQRLAQLLINSADMLPCRSIKDIIDDVIDNADDRSKNPGRIPGITTGFSTIDQYTGGQQEGRLWVVAGETSDGKSTLVQNFGCQSGAFGAIYSYEMPDTECAERLLCFCRTIGRWRINDGTVHQRRTTRDDARHERD